MLGKRFLYNKQMSSAPAPKPRKGVRAPIPGEEDVVAVRQPPSLKVPQYPALMSAMERLRQEQKQKDEVPRAERPGGKRRKTKKSKSKSKRRLTKKRRM